jgi:hypothetical protein
MNEGHHHYTQGFALRHGPLFPAFSSVFPKKLYSMGRRTTLDSGNAEEL